MKTILFKIEAITNMHVGSGDANYGIIDNLVQRDAVTTLPTINGSSLKGAMHQFFEEKWGKNDDKINEIFGFEEGNADYRFLSAKLLAIPMRSNKQAYFLATAPMVIEHLKQDAANFDFKIDRSEFATLSPKEGKPIIFTKNNSGLLIEEYSDNDFEYKNQQATNHIFGNLENIIYLNDNDFKALCSDTSLPVVARNKVGENLWYEQFVPHKSIFSFVLIHNNKNIDEFSEGIKNELIHIGANATIGQGFTKISEITKTNKS